MPITPFVLNPWPAKPATLDKTGLWILALTNCRCTEGSRKRCIYMRITRLTALNLFIPTCTEGILSYISARMLSSTRSALFPGNLGNSCGMSCFLRPKFTDLIHQFMPLITRRHYLTLRIWASSFCEGIIRFFICLLSGISEPYPIFLCLNRLETASIKYLYFE